MQAVIDAAGGGKIFDLSVDYFIGMPSWASSGDPPYQIWMTHTPQGCVLDGLTGVSAEIHEKYSMSVDSILLNTHCGTHIDTLTHLGYYGCFWNGWTEERHLGGRGWLKGGADKYPPIVARGVLLDVAALHSASCLPDSYAITQADLEDATKRQGVALRRGDVVLVRTGSITKWPRPEYLLNAPGLGLAAARYLCEEAGAMCVATDTIAFEVLPPEQPRTFLPVHCYMLATAGAQIMEVVNMEELAADQLYEFAFFGFPLRLRGSTGAPLRPIAVPLR
jgi:kynurenine formamidase